MGGGSGDGCAEARRLFCLLAGRLSDGSFRVLCDMQAERLPMPERATVKVQAKILQCSDQTRIRPFAGLTRAPVRIARHGEPASWPLWPRLCWPRCPPAAGPRAARADAGESRFGLDTVEDGRCLAPGDDRLRLVVVEHGRLGRRVKGLSAVADEA